MVATLPGSASSKKKAPAPAPAKMDLSRFVWPKAPAITRIKFLDFFSAEKRDSTNQKKKSGWMDRMAGVSAENDKRTRPHFELLTPFGLAVDSKGLLYVADSKVGAIFIFNPETHDVQLLKHGVDAQFSSVFGLAIDDNDQLLVTDGNLHHVLVFDPNHKLRVRFGEGILEEPSGIAIDTENRFIYVADTGLDQIVVFDADSFKPLRTIEIEVWGGDPGGAFRDRDRHRKPLYLCGRYRPGPDRSVRCRQLQALAHDRHCGQAAHPDHAGRLLQADQRRGRSGRKSVRQRYHEQPRRDL